MSDLRTRLDALIEDDAGRVAYEHERAVSAFTNDAARIMREQGISQADLARRLGVSRARVSQLLQHRSSPTLSTMALVAHALGSRLTVGLGAREQETAKDHCA